MIICLLSILTSYFWFSNKH